VRECALARAHDGPFGNVTLHNCFRPHSRPEVPFHSWIGHNGGFTRLLRTPASRHAPSSFPCSSPLLVLSFSLSFSLSLSLFHSRPPHVSLPSSYVRITARKVRGTLNIQQFVVIIKNFTDGAKRRTNLKV